MPGKAGTYNFEARLDESLKSWKAAVTHSEADGHARVGVMNLSRTGTLQGLVRAPAAPAGTSLLGVEVYVPGSPYDANGNYFLLRLFGKHGNRED